MEKKYKLEKYHYLIDVLYQDKEKANCQSYEEEDDLEYYFKLVNLSSIGISLFEPLERLV